MKSIFTSAKLELKMFFAKNADIDVSLLYTIDIWVLFRQNPKTKLICTQKWRTFFENSNE